MFSKKSHIRRSSGHGYVVSIIILAVCIAAAVYILLNKQQIVDQVSVWQYQPNADIVSLADRSGMNDTGKFYFYASHPDIEAAQQFNQHCNNQQETTTAILGCYDGRSIYIYNVTDPRLDGIKETTAAHEMLHAAYSRLDPATKQNVDAMLESEYAVLKNNKDFAERMAFYAQTEPGQRDNELHSVIGTEVGTLSPELEAYYNRYFSDRKLVVSLHDQYMSVFNQLQQEGDSLSAQITQLAATIQQQTQEYNAKVAELNTQIEEFNQKASSGGFSTQDQFNSARAVLVDQSNALETLRGQINSEISQYDTLRTQLQAISNQSQTLNQSINSTLAPAPSL